MGTDISSHCYWRIKPLPEMISCLSVKNSHVAVKAFYSWESPNFVFHHHHKTMHMVLPLSASFTLSPPPASLKSDLQLANSLLSSVCWKFLIASFTLKESGCLLANVVQCNPLKCGCFFFFTQITQKMEEFSCSTFYLPK